jgi:hypothetical protein
MRQTASQRVLIYIKILVTIYGGEASYSYSILDSLLYVAPATAAINAANVQAHARVASSIHNNNGVKKPSLARLARPQEGVAAAATLLLLGLRLVLLLLVYRAWLLAAGKQEEIAECLPQLVRRG